ncbi:MAG: sugar phosphate isomerase/epimerase [bacterium]
MLDVGISTGLFYHKDIFSCLDKIKNAGFKNVELWAGAKKWGRNTHFNYNDGDVLEKIKSHLRGMNLNVCSINAPFSGLLDISSIDEMQRNIAVNEIKKAVNICEFFETEHLIIHPCVKVFPVTDIEFIRKKTARIKKSMEQICENALLHRVKVSCENPAPHLLGGWAADLLEIIGDFPKDVVGVCLDTGHANMIGNPSEFLRDISGRLFTLHVSDNDGSYSAHLPPGQGKIDWDEFAAALMDSDFNGIFMLEILGSSRFEDPDEVLRISYNKAKEIAAKAGK